MDFKKPDYVADASVIIDPTTHEDGRNKVHFPVIPSQQNKALPYHNC